MLVPFWVSRQKRCWNLTWRNQRAYRIAPGIQQHQGMALAL
ncbi:hypothetical protein [Ktedonobacter sp. SOSP1-52]|nr:hypothetical protein [Ktedonobacter sp. SOSP1-52]